jgi:hypothetical protein
LREIQESERFTTHRLGKTAPPTCAWSTLDHLQVPVALSKTKVRQLLTPIGGVGPDLFQAWQERGKSGKQASGTTTIMQVGRGNIDRKQQAKCIYEDVPLTPLHMFVRIKPTDPSGFLDRFDALCIDDRCARLL